MAYDEAVRDLQRVQEEAQQQAQSRSRSRSKAGPSSSQHHSHEEEEDELATQVDKFRTDILTTQVRIEGLRIGESQQQPALLEVSTASLIRYTVPSGIE